MNAQSIEIAAEFLSGLLASRSKPPVSWQLLVLGGVAALVGAIFLAIAADLALAEWIPAPAAAAVVGGVLVAAALLLSWAAFRPRAAPQASRDALPIAALTDFAAGLLGEFEGVVQDSPKSSALAAFAVGCVIGCNPGLQRGLRDLIR